MGHCLRALNCTLVQYLLSEQDFLSSLLDTIEKTYTNKGVIRQYFPNILYVLINPALAYCVTFFFAMKLFITLFCVEI